MSNVWTIIIAAVAALIAIRVLFWVVKKMIWAAVLTGVVIIIAVLAAIHFTVGFGWLPL